METNGKHHTFKRGELWKHFPDTCNTYDLEKTDVLYVDTHDKHPTETSWGVPTEARILPSAKGLVVVLYFDQLENSHIVFITQVGPNRGAWQNIDWDPNFHRNWDQKRIKDAADNFLKVADRENSK
jgi:hypothetical protein